MTSNVGTEYINLKAAKYNRTIRENASAHPPVSEAYARHTSHVAAVPAKRVPSVRVERSSAALPEARYGFGDIVSDVLDELGILLAKRRREAAKNRANEAHYVKKSVRAAKPLPISLIGYIVIFSAIAMFLVLGNTKINEATLRVDALHSQISAAKDQGEILSSQLNARKDVSYIDDYAKNVLGMVKSTDVAKHYVSISGQDKVVTNGVTAPVTVSTDAAVLLDSVR